LFASNISRFAVVLLGAFTIASFGACESSGVVASDSTCGTGQVRTLDQITGRRTCETVPCPTYANPISGGGCACQRGTAGVLVWENSRWITACQACPIGLYAGDENMASCLVCPTGMTTSTSMSTSCTVTCQAGTIAVPYFGCSSLLCTGNHMVFLTNQCSCDAGFTGPNMPLDGNAIDAACRACDSGKYKALPGSADCTQCTVCQGSARTECTSRADAVCA
jgi:hypothetical protein